MVKLLKFFFYLLLIVFIVLSVWSRFYSNPYRLAILHGAKGSGKSTLGAKFAILYQNMGWSVFSDTPIYGCYKLDINWLGRNDFPERTLIIIDEGAISFDNRKFSTFSDELRNFFTMQRHSKVYVVILTQSYNMLDKKVRLLTDDIYVVVNYLNIFSIAKKVHRGTGLSQDQDGTGTIAETYTWELPFYWRFTFIPRWIHFFDSFQIDPKPAVPKIPHKFLNEAECEKYRSWKYYKVQQIKFLWHYVNERIPWAFIITEDHLQFIKDMMQDGYA